MRVISGTARGRKLNEPKGLSIRPTSDLVKESVFNMIQFDIEGSSVLDLFAGTGQLGIESLSRGAGSAVFVDLMPQAAKLIRKNIELCGFSDFAAVYVRDALEYIENSGRFDLIFIDPPYDSSIAGKAFRKIIEFDKLNPDGIIIYETKSDSATQNVSPPYFIIKEYRYGGVKIAQYRRDDGE